MSDNHNHIEPQVNESEIIKVRHEKLDNLINEGMNPFLQTKYKVT